MKSDLTKNIQNYFLGKLAEHCHLFLNLSFHINAQDVSNKMNVIYFNCVW
jgi:hypothetical protein